LRIIAFTGIGNAQLPQGFHGSRAAMAKITKEFIDKLAAKGREFFEWDAEVRGFGVRVMKSGRISFIVQYKTPQGATRRMVIGQVGALTPDQARKLAKARLAEVEQGRDPSAQRHEARTALTVDELCGQYLEAARAGLVLTRFRKPKRPRTIYDDEGRVLRHIKPLIGHLVAANPPLTAAVVQRMADAIAAGKTAGTFKTKSRGVAKVAGGAAAAARTVELFGGIWSWAERRGLVSGPNPARGVEKHKGDAKERFLNPDELARLGAVLREQEATQPAAVAALRLIAVTGLRREEACGLRWREIDATMGCLRLEATKTGRSMRPIGQPALRLLAALPRGASEWVFPNRDDTGSADLKKRIAELFDKAGLADARAHDLRRSYATIAADEGYGDATIGELLGHARRGVTAVHYIRRPDAALIAAADRVASRIAAAMESGNGIDILPLSRAREGVL
jgi:integrase